MAGIGPPPKDPSVRVGHRKGEVIRVVAAEPSAQPPLPDDEYWPDRTREWWAMWGRHPLAADFGEGDWSYLLDTAHIHARFWTGETKLAGELRLRVAAYGQTPADRARLRVLFASADDLENKTATASEQDVQAHYGGLRLATDESS